MAHHRDMTTTRITAEQAESEFPTPADRDAEYSRLDRLAARFAGNLDEEYLLQEIDYRRGVIESTDPRSPMSGKVPLPV